MRVWFKRYGWKLFVLLFGAWAIFDVGSYLLAESLWFNELGYLQAFGLRIFTQGAIWAIALCASGGFLLANLVLANLLQYRKSPIADLIEKTDDLPGMGLRLLVLATGGVSLAVTLIVFHYGKIAIALWNPAQLLEVVPDSLPSRIRPESIVQYFSQFPENLALFSLFVVLTIALTSACEFTLKAIAIALSIGFGFTLSAYWHLVLQYFHPTAFGNTDPVFGREVSFYVFTLPVLHLLEFWLGGLTLFTLFAILTQYLLSGDSLRHGRFPGFSLGQTRHLYALSACVMVTITFTLWLSRYELLYSARGVVYGASYTDVNVQLPTTTVLSVIAGAISVFLFWEALSGSVSQFRDVRKRPFPQNLLPPIAIFNLFQGLILFVAIAFLANYVLPTAVQRLIVQPNELARETPFLERSILFTRAAFDLNNIDVETFVPDNTLTFADLQENDLTIRNIRLWDTRPLLQTNRQLQQIRLYYRFEDADIDRYTFLADPPNESEQQQVILAARELDFAEVPERAQTWINEHLVYTHGYGFTMSPVNTVGPAGLPEYYVRDIGVDTPENGQGGLTVSSEQVRNSIPIGQPRIYYGELTNTNVMAPTRVPELDYPSGDENVYNTYDGTGGVPMGNFWRRALFAKYLKNWQILFTRNFTPQTRVLFRRNIQQRVRTLAPFLNFDRDPYLAIADADLTDNPEQEDNENHVYWIIDAYTTSDRYPYSDPGEQPFNYIRNSVKVVVDAYNGNVRFFVAEPRDPIIRTLASIFPAMFDPLNEMPAELRSHIRYPIDFFTIQSNQLLIYHMTDPQVFYNREDQWRVPVEIYGGQPQQVESYYLIMRLPNEDAEEFIILHPFTPASRNNLIAWLAGRSDGEQYGRLLLYQFPKQQLVYGPEQIEARINQDPEISQQISLWNRQGSRAIQGNLLVIPIENSLLYVEPLYLEAEQNSLPTLVRVIVAYENQIVMAETLEQALDAIFQPTGTTPAPTIIRPLEEETITPLPVDGAGD
ncbi:MAG: UPF0182 family protein [Desertifilum sp.]|nr:UPF0182 family protein [Desertifilum sp.]